MFYVKPKKPKGLFRLFLAIFLGLSFLVPAITPPVFAKVKDGARETFEAPEDAARIYIFRKKKMAGAALKFKLFLDDKEIGKIGSGRYHTFTIPPGEYTLRVKSLEKSDNLIITVKEGEVYFFKVKVKIGIVAYRGGVESINEIEGKYQVKKLKKGSNLYINEITDK